MIAARGSGLATARHFLAPAPGAFSGSVALALCLLWAGAAAAEPIVDTEQRFSLSLPDRWEAAEPPAQRYWTNPDTGQLAAVVRIDAPTQGAWLGDAEYFAGIEAGVKRSTPGYQRLAVAKGKLAGVPYLDLWFRRAAPDTDNDAPPPAVLATRFIFFRRYALSLLLETPAATYARHKRTLRRTLQSFQPHLQP